MSPRFQTPIQTSSHSDSRLQAFVAGSLGPSAEIRAFEKLQPLWGAYGLIVRLGLSGCAPSSLILKQVEPPPLKDDAGHRRKLLSYQVESAWYRHWSRQCGTYCRVAACYGLQEPGPEQGGWLFLLEDLAGSGYAGPRPRDTFTILRLGLAWLAAFHARFLVDTRQASARERYQGLWPLGSYWQLATRQAELALMPAGALKQAAARLDQRLNHCRFQTLVHGDAKPANMCFAADAQGIAMVDFQYVGVGCGMRDVAYLLECCFDQDDLLASAALWLDGYFQLLQQACAADIDFVALKAEWLPLLAYAVADFRRFLAGWQPGYASAWAEGFAQQLLVQAS